MIAISTATSAKGQNLNFALPVNLLRDVPPAAITFAAVKPAPFDLRDGDRERIRQVADRFDASNDIPQFHVVFALQRGFRRHVQLDHEIGRKFFGPKVRFRFVPRDPAEQPIAVMQEFIEQRAVVEPADLRLRVAVGQHDDPRIAGLPRIEQLAALFARQDQCPDNQGESEERPATPRLSSPVATTVRSTGQALASGQQPQPGSPRAQRVQRPAKPRARTAAAPEVQQQHVQLSREHRRDVTRDRRLAGAIRPEKRDQQTTGGHAAPLRPPR